MLGVSATKMGKYTMSAIMLLLLQYLWLAPKVAEAKLNLLENPSFEQDTGWQFWERIALWDVRPTEDSVQMSVDKPHKGFKSLVFKPSASTGSPSRNLKALLASQYINLQNMEEVTGSTSVKVSFQVSGTSQDLKNFKALLDICYADGRHMLADINIEDYSVESPDEQGFTEACAFIPSYGKIRALMLHLVVLEETMSNIFVDSVRVLLDQSVGKCALYTGSYPQTRQNVINFLSARELEAREGITLATQLTLDRLQELEAIAKRWQGPISAAVLLFNDNSLLELVKAYHKSATIQKFVTIHVIFEDNFNQKDSEMYPVNQLRNIAIANVQTSHVFYIDVDINPIFSEEDAMNSMQRLKVLDCPNCALIAPLFYCKVSDVTDYPETKEDLLRELNTATLYEHMGVSSHSAVKYMKWRTSMRSYDIPYVPNMEPYFVVPSGSPLLNDMFAGYGRDKCAYSKELNAAGFTFTVFPDLYLMNKKDSSSVSTMLGRSHKGGNLVNLRVFLNIAFHDKDLESGYHRYPPRQHEMMQCSSESCNEMYKEESQVKDEGELSSWF